MRNGIMDFRLIRFFVAVQSEKSILIRIEHWIILLFIGIMRISILMRKCILALYHAI